MHSSQCIYDCFEENLIIFCLYSPLCDTFNLKGNQLYISNIFNSTIAISAKNNTTLIEEKNHSRHARLGFCYIFAFPGKMKGWSVNYLNKLQSEYSLLVLNDATRHTHTRKMIFVRREVHRSKQIALFYNPEIHIAARLLRTMYLAILNQGK